MKIENIPPLFRRAFTLLKTYWAWNSVVPEIPVVGLTVTSSSVILSISRLWIWLTLRIVTVSMSVFVRLLLLAVTSKVRTTSLARLLFGIDSLRLSVETPRSVSYIIWSFEANEISDAVELAEATFVICQE